MSGINNKVAIVTGAGRGIGREIALTLARAGAIVIATDIEGSEATAEAAREVSPKSIGIDFDVAQLERIGEFVDGIAKQFGSVDILVNNAGVTRKIDFFDMTIKDFNWIVDVNIKGTFFMMQAAARWMREQGGGRVVNLGSIAGKGYKNTSNICYASTKGAITIMSRIAAVQLGGFNITVNTVCPGMTETEMMIDWMERRTRETNRTLEEVKSELTQDVALRRINSVTDIAQSVLFLVSPESRNITGQSLNVDGGTMWD